MSLDSVYVGSKVRDLTASPPNAEYTGVIINTSDSTYVSAGDITSDNANVLEVSATWATAADARRILDKLRGFRYRSYSATDALIDPAAEIGDAITVGNVYSGLYSQGISFSALMASDASAPQEEQIDNEYKYVSPQTRQYKREFAEVRATLDLTASQITAAVEQKLDSTGGTQAFSWELTATGFVLKNNGNVVFKADSSGITVNGDGTFTGNVYAKNIQSGGDFGTFNGSGITGGSITTTQTSSYINGGLADGYFSGDVFSGAAVADYCSAWNMSVGSDGFLFFHGLEVHQVNHKVEAGEWLTFLRAGY